MVSFLLKISIFLALLSSNIYSNMRLPRQVLQFPSSTIFKVVPLVVNKEILQFDCPEIYKAELLPVQLDCKVKAIYEILSSSISNSSYSFEFISPSNKAYKILVNKNPVKYTTTLVDTNSPIFKEHKIYSFCTSCQKEEREKLSKLYNINFSSKLIKGTNLIQIEYLQPLSSEEYNNYSKYVKWKHFFYYELWPLKEWNLSDNFYISVQITSPIEITPTKFQRKKIISCDSGLDTQFSEDFTNSTIEYSYQ